MKILVVDDALDMRLVMRRTLTLLGYEVTLAEDGQQAWDLLQAQHFPIVISDWMMPNMDGPTLCRKIRLATWDNYVYIVLLTGLSGRESLIQGMEAGADDFANKPIVPEEIAVRLRAAERMLSLEQKLARQNADLAQVNTSLTAAQELIQQELRQAAILQTGMLPIAKRLGPLRIEWFFKPAAFIGGDTFNYFNLADDLYLFYTVDVSGHGISAALLSMYLNNLLTTTSQLNLPRSELSSYPAQLATRFNQDLLAKKGIADHYFTMILGVIDTLEEKIHFVQAGHPRPFLINSTHHQVEELDCSGFPIGLLPDLIFESTTVDFKAGDRFVIYSDGLLELKDAQCGLLTEQRLKKALQQSAHAPIEKVLPPLLQNIICASNCEVCDQKDDVSIIVIDFTNERD